MPARPTVSAGQPGRTAAINIRVEPGQRDLIDQAARLSRKTRTEFILEAATRAAEDAILDQRLFQVSPEAFAAFAAALDRPAAPDAALGRLLGRKPAWER
ncbi:MAG: DUF1778 domain-containing protein [Desulfovibrio sp.]